MKYLEPICVIGACVVLAVAAIRWPVAVISLLLGVGFLVALVVAAVASINFLTKDEE